MQQTQRARKVARGLFLRGEKILAQKRPGKLVVNDVYIILSLFVRGITECFYFHSIDT